MLRKLQYASRPERSTFLVVHKNRFSVDRIVVTEIDFRLNLKFRRGKFWEFYLNFKFRRKSISVQQHQADFHWLQL